MNLITALKIMNMTSKALLKKYGSKTIVLSKKIKAKDMVKRAKAGKRLTPGGKYLTSKEASKAEDWLMKNKGRKLTKKEIERMEYNDAMIRGANDMNRKRG